VGGPRVLIDGHPASPEALLHQALVNYGAYTSFRVEDGGVRGLDRHLARLDQAARELFGQAPDAADLRAWARSALEGRAQAFVRISLFSQQIGHRDPTWMGRPQVMVCAFDPPPPLSDVPLRIQARTHRREAPHLKSVATFGLMSARRAARAAGYDDALFVDDDGVISEGTLWNVGFWQGDTLVWPDAPMLDGVTQALLREGLGGERRRVTLNDLRGFDAAFICNSATPACAVSGIDSIAFDPAPDRIERLTSAWRNHPPQLI
jgi:branched-subunit amino acid aminotransferase/4-amino-4-deoxychorismate lyase